MGARWYLMLGAACGSQAHLFLCYRCFIYNELHGPVQVS